MRRVTEWRSSNPFGTKKVEFEKQWHYLISLLMGLEVQPISRSSEVSSVPQ